MAFTVSAIAAKDGAGAAITGGLISGDIAGGGAGPWFLYHGLIDGVAGVNKAAIDANNALKIAVASGGIVSGALASGSVASGAVASGAFASGALASGSVASGAFASGALASGSIAAGAIAAGATSIAENEDVASADADRGVKIMFKRLDTPANSSGTDGDYEQPQMSAGRVWVSSSVTAIVPGTGATNLGTAIDTAAGATDTGVGSLFIRDDALTTLTPVDGDWAPGRLTSTGAIWVQDASLNANGQATMANSSPVVIASDQIKTDDAAFTAGTSQVFPVGFFADETATDSVDEGDAGAARMTLDRKVIVTPQPHTAGGLSMLKFLDVDETEDEVKSSAGQLYGVVVTNLNASVRYLKIYNNTAAGTVVGTTVPDITIYLPPTATGSINFGGLGVACGTGITIAATTGFADNDTGAPSANDVICNVLYK
jgi:hypothetical protein